MGQTTHNTTTLGARTSRSLKQVARIMAEDGGHTLSRYIEQALRAQVVRDLEKDRGRQGSE